MVVFIHGGSAATSSSQPYTVALAGWFVNSPRKTTSAFLHCNLKKKLQQRSSTLSTYLSSFLPPPRSAREQPTAPQGVPATMHLPRAPSPSPQPASRPALADPSPTPPTQPPFTAVRSTAPHSRRSARLPTRSCPSLLILALYSQHVGPPTAASCVSPEPPTAACASTALPKLRCTAH